VLQLADVDDMEEDDLARDVDSETGLDLVDPFATDEAYPQPLHSH